MIGSGLRKIAKEHGMKTVNGVAYGELMGYTTTMCEGGGWKRFIIATKLPEEMRSKLLADIGEEDLAQKFRVTGFSVSPTSIVVQFFDNPGTMKMIQEFIEWFYPQLEKYSATKSNYCPHCGEEITGHGQWKLINNAAYHMHETCMDNFILKMKEEHAAVVNGEGGSYVTGIIGAVLGALLGAIVWAFVLNMGYVASLVALFISWLAEKGYNLLKGKQGRGKMLILALVTLVAVVIGTFGSDAIEMIKMISSGEAASLGWTYADIPLWFATLFMYQPEYVRAFLANLLIGILFAGLGGFYFIYRKGLAAGRVKIKKL